MDPKRPDTLPTNPRFGGGGGHIPPNPWSSSSHRRAHSETFFRLPDEFLLDSDPDFNLADIDFPSISDDNNSGSSSTAAPAISNESAGRSEPSNAPPPKRSSDGGAHHLRSLSVDAAFFEGFGFQEPGAGGGAAPEKKPQHRYSSSMDAVTSPFEGESPPPPTPDYAKKAMAADKISELALIDPKRAKRILANRQSAARSKERKIRYTSELERKVQTLQTEATTISAQLTLLQRDSTGLTTENRELKLRLQAMEQHAHLQDALNEALREEVHRLKIASGRIPNANENPFNRGFQQSASPFHSHTQLLQNHGSHHTQQLQNHGSHHTQQLHSAPHSSHEAQHFNSAQLQTTSNGQAFSVRSAHDSMDLL